jgi:hypothetical protein
LVRECDIKLVEKYLFVGQWAEAYEFIVSIPRAAAAQLGNEADAASRAQKTITIVHPLNENAS